MNKKCFEHAPQVLDPSNVMPTQVGTHDEYQWVLCREKNIDAETIYANAPTHSQRCSWVPACAGMMFR